MSISRFSAIFCILMNLSICAQADDLGLMANLGAKNGWKDLNEATLLAQIEPTAENRAAIEKASLCIQQNNDKLKRQLTLLSNFGGPKMCDQFMERAYVPFSVRVSRSNRKAELMIVELLTKYSPSDVPVEILENFQKIHCQEIAPLESFRADALTRAQKICHFPQSLSGVYFSPEDSGASRDSIDRRQETLLLEQMESLVRYGFMRGARF